MKTWMFSLLLGCSLLISAGAEMPSAAGVETEQVDDRRVALAAPESLSMLSQLEDLQEQIDFHPPREYSTLRYPNGTTATMLFGKKGATWYWPNGKILTSLGGQRGASWYWQNGQMMTLRVGDAGSSWYWPDGKMMTNSGPGMSDYELLDVPALAVKMLRMATRRGF